VAGSWSSLEALAIAFALYGAACGNAAAAAFGLAAGIYMTLFPAVLALPVRPLARRLVRPWLCVRSACVGNYTTLV
jgi:hypothetical protein